MSAMYRQGDVLIRRVADIPVEAIRVDNVGRIVLAHGEAAGHAHAVDADYACEFSLEAANGTPHRFLEVLDQGAIVTHEEHAPISLPAGLYEIVRQREYVPMGLFDDVGGFLNVAD